MAYLSAGTFSSTVSLCIRKPLFPILAVGILAMLFAGCDSTTSANEEEKQSRTFELVMSSDNTTKVGEITTSEITEGDDAYIDEGFFVTISLSGSGFSPPFDISMTEGGGICGTFNVQPDKKAEMPCDYQEFLANPGNLIVTSDNGNGEEAYAR